MPSHSVIVRTCDVARSPRVVQVESMFDVHVTSVNTMNVLGKERRVGRHIGRRPSWKKAIVTLKKGDSIEFFEHA